MIQNYINQINDSIRANCGRFEAKINGIAQPISTIDSDERIMPALTINGESTDVFIDDDFDFGLYHKQRGITYQENESKGYGNQKQITETQDLSLIAWGFENKITAEEFKDFFLAISPEFVRFVSVSFDKRAIFNNEFKGAEFIVNEETFLIEIKYKVQYTVNKSCLEINEKFNK